MFSWFRLYSHFNFKYINVLFCFFSLQELQIQVLSAEIESLKNSQNLSSSAHLEALIEENSRLKYRFNILNRVSDGDGVFSLTAALKRRLWDNIPLNVH